MGEVVGLTPTAAMMLRERDADQSFADWLAAEKARARARDLAVWGLKGRVSMLASMGEHVSDADFRERVLQAVIACNAEIEALP